MLTQIPYNRELAVAYARKWALSRNPLFADFSDIGGNCTSFVSQCLLAGCGVMDFTPTFGWYYRSISDRAPAWSGVEALYDFLTSSGDFNTRMGEGPYASLVRNRREIQIGDVIQLANSAGQFYHTLIISGFEGNDILVCAHTNDALDRPLSTYDYSSLRVLHVIGALIDLPFAESYANLSDGLALQVVSAETVNV